MRTKRAYTLVEMLVVVGIIVLVTGLVLPAVMKARRAARGAICMENLRELGRMVHAYADQNGDLVPIGANGFAVLPDMSKEFWSGDIWSVGRPQPPLGPMLLNGMLHQGNAKLCYCPIEATKGLSVDVFGKVFPPVKNGVPQDDTIAISYISRPRPQSLSTEEGKVINHIVLDAMMPRLSDLGAKAIIAEPPLRLPANHGAENSPAINVLYSDGSVRQVFIKMHWPKLGPNGLPLVPTQEEVRMPLNREVWPWLDLQ